MPNLEAALFDYLTADPGIAGLVGDRIFPLRGPEGVQLSYIAWQRVGAQRLYTYDDFEDTSAWVRARIQFSCWAVSSIEAMRVGEAVLLALSGYDGDMAGQLVGSSFAVLEMDDYEPATRLYRRILDFSISYEDDLVGS